MKVLLINPPGWQSGSVSLGLGYLAAVLGRDGHEVRVLDETGKPLHPEALAARAARFSPDLVGFHCKTAQANAAAAVSSALKKILPSAPHAAGGPHVTLCHEEFLKENPSFEYGVLGEAEASLPELCRRLAAGQDIADVPGLAYRCRGTVAANPAAVLPDLDSLPRPDFDAIDDFTWQDFRYPLLTSRGCPYRCSFCSVPSLSGRRFRARSPEGCVSELSWAKRDKGVERFEILDDNFTLDLDRAKEFCRVLIRSGLSLSWYCHNGIRADRLDRELARLMASAGCTSLAFGIESGDPEVFRRIGKAEELAQIASAVRMTRDAGMKAVGYFIIGLPGDHPAAVQRTILFQRSLDLDHSVYGLFIPYPGTAGREDALREGRLIVDIKAVSHFSDRPRPAVEYPSFTAREIEDSFLLAAMGDLSEIIARSQGSMDRVLYVETHPPSRDFRRLSRWFPGGVDIFVHSLYDGSFEEEKRQPPPASGERSAPPGTAVPSRQPPPASGERSAPPGTAVPSRQPPPASGERSAPPGTAVPSRQGLVREVFSYERSPYRLKLTAQFLRLFREFRGRDYQLALFPFAWRKSPLLAFVFLAFWVIVGARHTVLYDFAANRFLEVRWSSPRFRRHLLEFVLLKVFGDPLPRGAWRRAALLPLHLLRLAAEAALFAVEFLLARTAYVLLYLYLALFYRPR